MMNKVTVQQKHMSATAFVGWIIAISTIQWMSLDIYLPAMPQIRDAFGVTEAALNSTLSVYVVVSAFGSLIGGPLSDKYGRKKLLFIGMLLFAVFNFLCTFANTLPFLLTMRCIAAFGSGFATTVPIAMVKDSLSGHRFRKAMTFLQSLAIIGPILAPVAGAMIISWLSWRYVFAFLAVLCALSAIPALFMEETLVPERRVMGSVWKTTGNLFVVVRDKGFSLLLIVVSLLTSSWYSYMAVCSYIYIDHFQLSYFMYSVFYGAAAAASFVAPFLYLTLGKWLRSRYILDICIVMMLISGVLILTAGSRSAFGFFLMLLIFLLSEGMSRPMGLVILMEQHEETAGAASAVSGFGLCMVGTLGTITATLGWGSYITGLGIILIATALIPALIWTLLLHSGVKIKGI